MWSSYQRTPLPNQPILRTLFQTPPSTYTHPRQDPCCSAPFHFAAHLWRNFYFVLQKINSPCTHLVIPSILTWPFRVIAHPQCYDTPYGYCINPLRRIYSAGVFVVAFSTKVLQLRHGHPIGPFVVPCPQRMRQWRQQHWNTTDVELSSLNIWGAVFCAPFLAWSHHGTMGVAWWDSFTFVDIIVVINVIMGATFVSFKYMYVWSSIVRGVFYLTCYYPRKTSIFDMVFVISNIFIVTIILYISLILINVSIIFIFAVVQSCKWRYRRRNQNYSLSVTNKIPSLKNNVRVCSHPIFICVTLFHLLLHHHGRGLGEGGGGLNW